MAFDEFAVRPIGVVANQFRHEIPEGWERSVSEVHVDSCWEVALEGIEEFSHIVVLFWLNRIEGERALRVHPMGRLDAPLVGLFSTRTPRRPNPIGLTVVRLLERRGSVLAVEGLDALDGSPVLDLKPYLTRNDRVQGATMPDWVSGAGD
jgi:tRNA-Thr(GGU) m(6)t(6)A37 methyltransferase TsaA